MKMEGNTMSAQKRTCWVIAALFMMIGCTSSYAAVQIDVDGIDGANQWIGFEAEFYKSSNVTVHEIENVSYSAGKDIWVYAAHYVEWDVYLPSAMTDAKVSIYDLHTKWYKDEMYLDGIKEIGMSYTDPAGGWSWTQPGTYGAVTAGAHVVKVEGIVTTDTVSYDTLFLQDGAFATPAMSDGYFEAPAAAGHGAIAGRSLNVSVTGAASSTVLLDGNPYTSGDGIGLGNHRLTVETFDAVGTRTTFYGADFEVTTPPPGTVIIIK